MKNPIKKLTVKNRKEMPNNQQRKTIVDKICKIIKELYKDPKYKKYSDMQLIKVTNNGITIEYTKYQGWCDGSSDSDSERDKTFQAFKKELFDRIHTELSEELEKYGIKIVEDDDFYLALQEGAMNSLSDRLLLKLYENTDLSDNEKEYLVVLMEMKTKEEYRKRQFEKHYQGKIDKDGNGEITINGERRKIHKSPAGDIASFDKYTGEIHINPKKLFKIRGSKNRDFIIQHEIGHSKLHTIDIDSPHLDKTRTNVELRYNSIMPLYDEMKNGDPTHDEKVLNALLFTICKPMKPEDENKPDPQKIELRKQFQKSRIPYDDPSIHSSMKELEADQFAANKTSRKTAKKAFKQYQKNADTYSKMDIEQRIKQMKSSDWYKRLNNRERQEIINEYREIYTKQANDIKRKNDASIANRNRALKGFIMPSWSTIVNGLVV